MSDEPERQVKRTITIEIYEGNDFNVIDGDRYSDRLCWDEMLGTIAELTHPKIAQARYRMLTKEEWKIYSDRWKVNVAKSNETVTQESQP